MKPADNVRQSDQYKRQLFLLEAYLKGRVRELGELSTIRLAEKDALDMAQSELLDILNNVIPQMREVQA